VNGGRPLAGNPQLGAGLLRRARAQQLTTIRAMTSILADLIDLNGRPHYLHSGWFLISVANLVVVVVMVVVFVLAIVLPFPRDRSKQ
jgi:hypothetical protein